MRSVGIRVARQHALQRAAEVGDADPQHGGVERHVDTGHQDERPLAAGSLAAPLDLFLQRFQAATVPAIAYCEPRRLKLTISRNSPVRSAIPATKAVTSSSSQADLRRPDGGHPVVGAAHLVARHDVVHLAAALEHDLEHRLERKTPATRPARCTHRPSARRRWRPRRTHRARAARRPGRRHRRHRDLGELGQVQHAVGVVVVHARGDQAGRVVAHHVQNREAQRVAGVLVGASHTLRAALDRARASRPMPLCWMPWPGKA